MFDSPPITAGCAGRTSGWSRRSTPATSRPG